MLSPVVRCAAGLNTVDTAVNFFREENRDAIGKPLDDIGWKRID